MQEIPFEIGRDRLFKSKTTCFTLKNDYDRETNNSLLKWLSMYKKQKNLSED